MDSFYIEAEFIRGQLLSSKDYKYLATPKQEDYLTLRQQGQLEGIAEKSGRTGTYDIASRLGIYNPITSFSADYSPNRRPYNNKSIDYLV
ncbi:MAG: hypothetical protein AABX05_01580 [Nanoarchaeota archaeon]